ncbi:unnamed protein product [Blepharisma stoltei]|uniref:Uncharacterized protein n=1 Tax=Blepharisma stoltei TaxID=1481888 RepID=A0AAU9ISA9_9CILI|nr:unnamed protein product [Blepharisma stoltei]
MRREPKSVNKNTFPLRAYLKVEREHIKKLHSLIETHHVPPHKIASILMLILEDIPLLSKLDMMRDSMRQLAQEYKISDYCEHLRSVYDLYCCIYALPEIGCRYGINDHHLYRTVDNRMDGPWVNNEPY